MPNYCGFRDNLLEFILTQLVPAVRAHTKKARVAVLPQHVQDMSLLMKMY